MKACFILGAAALVAASPAATGFDFAAIEAAPQPTGPAVGVSSQEDVYDSSAAEQDAVDAGSSLNKRTFGWWPKPGHYNFPSKGHNKPSKGKDCDKPKNPKPEPQHSAPAPPPGHSGPPPPPPSHSGPQPPKSTDCDTTSGVPTSTEAPSTTEAPTTTDGVPSTCTPVSWTNTFAFTTDPACPEPYEVGTYCGFINPEDPCAPQPDGYGPVPSPDTVEAFQNSEELHSLAKNAKDPKGYKASFKDLSAAVNANTYLGFHTLESYDVEQCAALCDDKELCTAFNIYIERDPKWNPEQCSCNIPDSITNFKCSLWGSGVEPEAATNVGEHRGDFEVVIVGSNGYQKSEETQPETPEGCSKPAKCPAAHDKPQSCLKEHFFPGPFDVSLCAKFAHSHNAQNKLQGRTFNKKNHCSFFNAFMIKENHVAKGTYCKLFSEIIDSKFATWTPGHHGGNSYSLETSWSYCVN